MSTCGIILNYSYSARLGHAVPSFRAVAAHKTTERDACYLPTSTDARNQPVQMGEHLAANHVAQMRCIRESRQDRLGIQIAARAHAKITGVAGALMRQGWLSKPKPSPHRRIKPRPSTFQTSLRMRRVNPSRYFLKVWPFASYC